MFEAPTHERNLPSKAAIKDALSERGFFAQKRQCDLRELTDIAMDGRPARLVWEDRG